METFFFWALGVILSAFPLGRKKNYPMERNRNVFFFSFTALNEFVCLIEWQPDELLVQWKVFISC